MSLNLVSAGPSKVTEPPFDLREVLLEEWSKVKNYSTKNFISLERAKEVLTSERILAWQKNHPLKRSWEHDKEDQKTVNAIITAYPLVFCVLIIAEIEYLTVTFMKNGFFDWKFFDKRYFELMCQHLNLSKVEIERLTEYRYYIGATFQNREHQIVPKNAVLPYKKREDLDRVGSFGVIYKLTLAPGHLRGCDSTVVAEKRIRASNDPSSREWRQLYREVDTLRRKQHPAIVNLLASYYLESEESGFAVQTLHLIFPWAEMDLETWMNSPDVPSSPQEAYDTDQNTFICRSIYSLISGLAYLHQDMEGTFTSHHDLKPRNILVVNGEFKIGDFGRSHLHALLENSTTEAEDGLGSYDYQPPEYWKNDGSRAAISHGRAFDTWSMGCIMFELLILIAYGRQSQKVALFKTERQQNTRTDRPIPTSVRNGVDASFHNNTIITEKWAEQLKREPIDRKILQMLVVIEEMLDPYARQRITIWEVKIELYEILSAYDTSIRDGPEGCPRVPQPPRTLMPDTQNAFHRAIRFGGRERVQQFLEQGWPVFIKDKRGLTPSQLMEQSKDELVRRLEKEAECIVIAASEGDIGAMKDFIARGLSPLMLSGTQSALSRAAELEQTEMVDFLLSTEARKHLRFMGGGSKKGGSGLPLHLAAKSGSVDCVRRILKEDILGLNLGDANGDTPLTIAAEAGHLEVVRVLLSNGALISPPKYSFTELLPNPRDYMSTSSDPWAGYPKEQSRTPLHAASDFDRAEVLELLLEVEGVEAHLASRDSWGNDPIMHAMRNNRRKCFGLLRDRGAKLDNVSAMTGQNCLHYAAEFFCLEILEAYIHEFPPEMFGTRQLSGSTPYESAKEFAKSKAEREGEARVKRVIQLLKKPPQSSRQHANIEPGVNEQDGRRHNKIWKFFGGKP